MSTPIKVGKRVEEIELLDLFPAEEGTIDQYYGRVGNGKTYNATADIIADLRRGEVVYANWRVNVEDFDQRDQLRWILLGLLGIKRRFYRFKKENLHFIEIDDDFMDKFEQLTDCKVYLDEGHVIFDSYQHAKFSLRKRKAILHTRHFNRSIIIISQRPTAVHVSARANVNRFFKCERLLKWPVLIFRKTQYQDMKDETVDEEAKPISRRWYFASKKVLNAYNSKYLRGGIPRSQRVFFEAYDLNFSERFWALSLYFRARLPWLKPREPAPVSPKLAELKKPEDAEKIPDNTPSLFGS